MFNRQPFNRGKFNRTTGNANSVLLYGSANMSLDTTGRLTAIMVFAGTSALNLTVAGRVTYSANIKGEAALHLIADGTVIRSQHVAGDVTLLLVADGSIIRAQNINGHIAMLLTASTGGFNTFTYSQISLPGLEVRAGDELFIDTDNMTVTLNGQNVMRFVSRDSEFFRIRPGHNEILYEGTGNNSQADIRILWKDAWL